LKAVSFKNFEASKSSKPWEMSSFVETKVTKFTLKSPVPFVEYNSRQLSRIYPKGMRVDSSNYDPWPSWNHGCQIVALNYQTGSDPRWINDGKFLDNGNSGYILKPKYMTQEKISFNPEAKAPVQKVLKLTIMSGWMLPKHQGVAKQTKDKGEVIDPYVKVKMVGVAADIKSGKTKVIKNNGFNPVWKADFKFPLTQPDLAVLLFAVSDSDLVSKDDFLAQYALQVSNMREGYRTLPLRAGNGDLYDKASLLVHVEFSK